MDKKMHMMNNDIFKIKKIEKTKNNIERQQKLMNGKNSQQIEQIKQ